MVKYLANTAQDRTVETLRGLGKHWLPLVLSLVLGGVIGWAVSAQRPAEYTAEARLFFAATSPFDPLNQNKTNDTPRFIINQAEIMESDEIIGSAAKTANLTVPLDEIRGRVEVLAGSKSDLVTVRAIAGNPRAAAALANAITSSYSAFVKAGIAETVKDLGANRDPAAAATINDIRQKAQLYGDGIRVRETAQPPARPSGPQTTRDAVFFGIFGLLLCAAFLLARQLIRSRASTPSEIAAQLGAPVAIELSGPNANQELIYGLVAMRYAAGRDAVTLLMTDLNQPQELSKVVNRSAELSQDLGLNPRVVGLEDLSPGAWPGAGDAELTLVEAPDLIHNHRTFELASRVEGVVLITGDSASREELTEVRSRCAQARVPIVGVIAGRLDTARVTTPAALVGRAEARQRAALSDPLTVDRTGARQ